MRRFLCAVCTLASVTLLGCSLFNGKEGFLDRASAKDTKETLMIKQCDDGTRLRYCHPDPSTPECREHCG
jgi:hypothetical protein